MNFTRDNAEIPAWMMCTEGHENGLPAEVRKSPRGSASEKCLISQCHPSRSVAGDRLYFKIPTFRTGLGRRYTRFEVLPVLPKEHLCLDIGFYPLACKGARKQEEDDSNDRGHPFFIAYWQRATRRPPWRNPFRGGGMDCAAGFRGSPHRH